MQVKCDDIIAALAEFHPVEGPIFSVIIPKDAPIDITLEFEIASSCLHLQGFAEFNVNHLRVYSHSFDIKTKNRQYSRKFALVILVNDEKISNQRTRLETLFETILKEYVEKISRVLMDAAQKMVVKRILKEFYEQICHITLEFLAQKRQYQSMIKELPPFVLLDTERYSIITNLSVETIFRRLKDKRKSYCTSPNKKYLLIIFNDETSNGSIYPILEKIIMYADLKNIDLAPQDITYVCSVASNVPPNVLDSVLSIYFSRYYNTNEKILSLLRKKVSNMKVLEFIINELKA